ncbi:Serine/threonine-protein phosphatase 6 regulatory subunit 3-like protein [Dinothrombium tinctorium]|uniref:Serine/threonine-protein phosphatase 6 regulatory subunit 3-like protein n=1 Tax=Dinothrombium tinctorium TaxID=1965070 RepID=A0A3S3P077_9ACAR|nr:Serine/threonine-protein phosphatase 6 regulatory subunit 3-like protein [Dinothrombium tinctorium]RWS09311.1 Serine/threonine-protein phosphatase 6 regulatory subunit 3-like protein [Dinothrombium tinctorium]
MFWEFQGAIVSQIDTLLENESVTLTELIEEDDILQECKASNQKLLCFLTKPEIMEQLVTLIITEPPEESDEKMRYKKANIACELLTSDVSSINEALISNSSLLNKLFSFIECGHQLNPLLASFFSKTMSLLSVKRCDALFEFLKTKEDFVIHVINHIETSAIMDFLLKLITASDNLVLRAAITKWLHEKDLIRRLILIFKSEYSSEAQANAAQFLCDLIKAIRDHQSSLQEKAEPDLLLQDIESTSTISELLNEMFNTRTESSIVNGINILQSLLEYKRHCANIQQQAPIQSNMQTQNNDFEGIPTNLCIASNPMFTRMDLSVPDQMTALDAERLSRGVRKAHAAIIPRLKDFHSVLLNPPLRSPIHTTIGVIEKPLGATRLEVVHLIRALLSSNNPEVNQKLSELKTVHVLIDLFFSYPWNNFLHTQVEQSIKSILNNSKSNSPVTSPTPNDDISNLPSSQETTILLVKQLFSDSQLIKRMLDAWDCFNNEENKQKQPRPGYMGHIIKIANHIVASKDQEVVATELQNLSAEYSSKWNRFVNETLAEINKRIQTPLVNEIPTSAPFDKNSIRQQENALQQAFIEYQMQQMTKSLCTQIEFSAAEFTEIDENIQPQVDHLSKVNFNLESQLVRQASDTLSLSCDLLQQESTKTVDLFEQMCAERVKTSLDSNSSDEEDLWEDRDISFTRSTVTEHKSQNSFKEPYGSNSADVTEIKMDVDQSDVWNDVSSPSVANSSIETDPWSTPKVEKKEKFDSDSWADFSSFTTAEFPPSQPPPNICISSVSSMMPSSSEMSCFPTEDAGGAPNVAVAEATDSSKDLADMSSAISNVSEEKGNNLSSNIDSNVLNGPH